MAAKNKLQRFAENLTFDNLFQLQYEELIKGFDLKGNWSKNFFNNDNEIVLELGCGKGEYTIGLAKKYPDKNFIGIDIKGSRMYLGLKEAKDDKMNNVAFIRARINLIEMYFGKGEISEIWITFPDPQPRETIAKRRLTSSWFLNMYKKFLKPDGVIHLKTDNIIVFESTLDMIKEYEHELLYSSYDIYNEGIENELTRIQTFYEKIWLGRGTKIKYLEYKLNRNEG